MWTGLLVIFIVTQTKGQTLLTPETYIKVSQKYNQTLSFVIDPSLLLPNSKYEIKTHSLGSEPNLFGVSLYQEKHYTTNQTFLDESNIHFSTNENGCVKGVDMDHCEKFNCFVALLYMGRTAQADVLNKPISYFISLKRGKLGLPGDVPALIVLGIFCLLIAGALTLLIKRFFEGKDSTKTE
ncbi:hypothetical protein EIN_495540 [Entamoeba invadens IP1]|uniref:Uncharacterized protein n=1 Tax=Entamoeba invadens IP1 TaxID=370355 RepID=A0A0A1TZR1_ENTIV|nr:hypothetical protein EIN_495540 [Entamoeba invadens IP1]ELP87099.1 hypothetical protein EIN_495540 [Entamoeba invadens IP1]|eukprot:XP_004253870.1 hypothetical protein EIN_495540 [Entamoeba invadens IP1]